MIKLRPFYEARGFIHLLKLKSSKEWQKYCKSRQKPKDIQYSPSKAYKNEWGGWSDWLGTITPREIKYVSD